MSESTVTLLHLVRRQGEQLVGFYDGSLTAKDGLLALPANRLDWIEKAWRSGYNLSPSTGERFQTWEAVLAEVEKQSTKSTGEKVEDSDAGRQPKAKDGIRES